MNEKSQDTEGDKIAVNFYLTSDALEKVEDFLFLVKKRLPMDKRRKLTRTVFYEIGLQIAIEEFNKKGEDSSLWKAIQERMAD